MDALYDADQLAGVIEALQYSLGDEKAGRPNPTKLRIDGNPYNVLNNFKTGVRTYREFRDSGGESEVANDAAIELAGEALREKREGRQFELERHLQESLRGAIEQLEPGLVIVDDGVERAVDSGFIDILAVDQAGALVVIELKAGIAKREALGQILGYMGDLKMEEPESAVRGILVAAAFDKSCKSARVVTPSIQLREYRFVFDFVAPE
ncbi:endonuclease NucS [Sphingomonas sp. DG1-23]|uniref:endonuclease NucS domain-containing protein n=1 Tax=Sphingomonas sp. DG1-23 TaxID=3068316 RepID=UPI00273F153F|nr:endonuclease NucS domain-containing protein [Sphingomonas sp. DG1-23]MDP5280161.1 endonuclease NucS [Sphingomonas sp. DG1-23]